MISCASINQRIHSSSSNCFEVGSFAFFKNMGCVLRRNRHSSSKSPVAHLTVRISSPSKQTPPLSGSCEGDDCVQMFLSFACWPWSTCGRQFGVRERHYTCFAASLFPHGASRCSVPSTTPSCPRRLGTFCTGNEFRCPSAVRSGAVLQVFQQSAEPCAAPPRY